MARLQRKDLANPDEVRDFRGEPDQGPAVGATAAGPTIIPAG